MPNYSAGSASVDITPNFEHFVEQLRAELEAVDAKLAVKVDLDDKEAQAQLAALTRERRVKVKTGADTDGIVTDLDKAETVAKKRKVKVATEADTKGLTEGLEKSKKETEKKPVKLPVKADLDPFQKDLVRRLEALGKSSETKIPLTVDGEQFRRRLRTAIGDAARQVRLPLPDDADAATRTRRRLSIQVGGLEAGTSRAIRDMTADAKRAGSALGGVESNLRNVGGRALDVGRSAAEAAEKLTGMSAITFGGLALGLGALIPILGGIVEGAGAAIGVFGALGAAIGIGGAGVLGALKAMQEAHADNNNAIQDTAERAKEALEGVQQAQDRVVDAQHSEKDALTAVTDAQHEQQESLQRTKDAQRELTEARVDARNELDNLALAERRGQLSERGARLSYERARVALQRVVNERARGEATNLDVQEAQQQVDEASQNITDVRVRNAQQRQQFQRETAKGVEGSDRVHRDREGVVNAQFEQQRAQRAVSDAQFNVIRSQHEVRDAVQAVSKAQYEAAKATQAAAFGTDALRIAMGKLSPNAQIFVRDLSALGPEWHRLQQTLQNNLFAGLGDSVTRLAQDQFPALNRGAGELGTIVNGVVRESLDAVDQTLRRLEHDGTAKKFLDGVSSALSAVPSLISGGISAIAHFTAAAGPDLGKLGKDIGDALAHLHGGLGKEFLDMLLELAPHLGNFIKQLSGPDGLGPKLPDLAQKFGQLLDKLGPFIDKVGHIAFVLLPPLLTGITDSATAIDTMIDAFDRAWRVAEKLASPLERILKAVTGLSGGQLGHLLVGAFGHALSPLGAISGIKDTVTQPHSIIGNAQAQPPGVTVHRPEDKIGGNAAGGMLPTSGPGTGRRDGILGVNRGTGVPMTWLDGGEMVVNHKQTAANLPLLLAINAAKGTLKLPGLADGGVALQRAEGWAQTEGNGQPYVYGGLDCSMFASGVYRELTGGDPSSRAFDTTRFATDASAAELGFMPGMFGDFSVGVTPLPGESGHMAFTLGGIHGESGGAHNSVLFGPGAAGADDPQFSVIYSLPGKLYSPPESDDSDQSAGGGAAQQAAQAPGAQSKNPSDYSPDTGTYVGPGGPSVDSTGETQKDLSDAQDKDDLSVQGFLRKGADALSQGILSGFGAENSILSHDNPWNKAFNDLWNANKALQSSGGIHFGPPPAGSKPPFSPLFDAFAPPATASTPGGAVTGALPTAPNTVKTARTNPPPGGITLKHVIKGVSDLIPGLADGGWGWVSGVGGPRSDRNLRWLSNREFVVNAAGAAANAGMLEAINDGAVLTAAPAVPNNLTVPSRTAPGGTRIESHIHDPRVADVYDLAELAERNMQRAALGLTAGLYP